MLRKSILFLIILVLAVLFFLKDFFPQLPKTLEREMPVLVEELQNRISTPPPLIVEVRLPASFLTQAGVIQFTNLQRQEQGLPPLRENLQLNFSASLKAEDMLAKQYFGHISPEDQGVGDLAQATGYEFIAIGENLALGDFENDESLVQGWMDSPGHRANILSSQYQEIGVAVLKGEYEGRTTWLAVQHFAKPLASCSQPSEELSAKIMEKQKEIERLYFTLSQLQDEINNIKPKRGQEYNQKVEEYNALVSQYNALIDETKSLIEKYNNQVILFNECAKG